MPDQNTGYYTFYPKFQEFITLYRGVVRVWIGDGISTGTAGYLYAEYMDGLVQQLGFVSDYEEAKKYFADLGIDLTYPEWIERLAQMPENAKRSEAWAVGTQIGVPVDPSDETHNNNARSYADQSKIWASGDNLDGASVQPEDNAAFWAHEAHGWTNNKEGSVNGYSETNNAKYWTEQSQASAMAAVSSQSAAAQSATNAFNSASQASTKASEASQSASAAASSASTASTKANEAAQSATSAASSATSASSSASAASTKADNASQSATAASNSATSAQNSATSASQSATAASNSATAASQSVNKAREWAVSPDPVETVSGVTYESSRTYAMRCGQEIDSRIEVMRQATNEANAATTSANTAASSANTVATKLENMSSTTVTLPSSSSATTNVRTENNHFVIDFGIPKGEQGEKGERGLPDYLATSVVDDTAESGIIFDWGADREALTAKSIFFDTSVSNPQTIYEVVQPITNAQIDNLFT